VKVAPIKLGNHICVVCDRTAASDYLANISVLSNLLFADC
jgi:hypothetical protein